MADVRGNATPDDPARRAGDPLAGFTAKWRTRWPEWGVAEAFVPVGQRQAALAWATLQQELTDAAWGGSDPRPGEAKLGWWQEELAGWSRGARRHPLGQALQRLPAPWSTLAVALPSLAASRERPGTADEAFAALASFAEALARVDAALFAAPVPGVEVTAAGEGPARAIAATLALSRLIQNDAHGVPLAVLARADDADPRLPWARELRERWPSARAEILPRRLWTALARARLEQPDPAQPRASWRTLATAWRAARAR